MGTRLPFLQESGQGRLGWQTSKSATAENITEPKVKRSQARCPLNLQKPDQEVPIDKFPSQTKICQQWEAEMERLNTKYNLDCFSDSELDSESDGEQYYMSMGMKHLFEKCQNTEFIKIKFFNDTIFKMQFDNCFSEI